MGGAPSKPISSSSSSSAPAVTSFDEKKAAAIQMHAASQRPSYESPEDDGTPGWSSVPIETLSKWSEDVELSPTLQLSKLVLHNADPLTTITSRQALIGDAKVFNTNLKGINGKGAYPGPRTNQASSGRCWLFATTHVLRYNVMEMCKLDEFELSQPYLFFYDKLEKANYYLENMMELADEPTDDRTVSFLGQGPVFDGGQWDMAVNVLEKYGCVPKVLYPESFSSMASSKVDNLITSKVREFALVLRAESRLKSVSSLRKIKSDMMAQIYSTLVITCGSPPRPDDTVKWDYYDTDGKYHSWSGTPKEYFAQFCKRKHMDPSDSFSLINDPRNEYEKLYTVERLGNVWGGRPVRYVNAPTEALEDAVIAGIKANTPMFFGCDVGKCSDRVAGVMDTALFNMNLAYGFDLNMTKAQRLEMGDSAMTHAMVITAVHLDDSGRPLKYKVENSWSETSGEKGWFMMTADWFREYVYQVVVPRSLADKKWTTVLDGGNAVVLKPWDPMGALA